MRQLAVSALSAQAANFLLPLPGACSEEEFGIGAASAERFEKPSVIESSWKRN